MHIQNTFLLRLMKIRKPKISYYSTFQLRLPKTYLANTGRDVAAAAAHAAAAKRENERKKIVSS